MVTHCTDVCLLELTESFSAMSLSSTIAPTLRSDQRPRGSKSLQDLPIELLLEIYKNFDHVSQIVALNSTSRMFYQTWRLDPARISSAVLPRSIAYYDATVDIQEAEERQQKLDPYRRCDPVKILKTLLEGCLAVSPVASNKAAYAATMAHNQSLLDIARKADRASELCNTSCVKNIGRERIIHAFYRIWHMTIRNSREAVQHQADLLDTMARGGDRDTTLRAMDVEKRDDMARVVRFLLFECSGKELIRLGINEPLRENPASCRATCHWISEFFRVAAFSHDWKTSRWLLDKNFRVFKDC